MLDDRSHVGSLAWVEHYPFSAFGHEPVVLGFTFGTCAPVWGSVNESSHGPSRHTNSSPSGPCIEHKRRSIAASHLDGSVPRLDHISEYVVHASDLGDPIADNAPLNIRERKLFCHRCFTPLTQHLESDSHTTSAPAHGPCEQGDTKRHCCDGKFFTSMRSGFILDTAISSSHSARGTFVVPSPLPTTEVSSSSYRPLAGRFRADVVVRSRDEHIGLVCVERDAEGRKVVDGV